MAVAVVSGRGGGKQSDSGYTEGRINQLNETTRISPIPLFLLHALPQSCSFPLPSRGNFLLSKEGKESKVKRQKTGLHGSKKTKRRYKGSRRVKVEEARNGHQQEKKQARKSKTEMLSILIAFSSLSFSADCIKVNTSLNSSIGKSLLGKYWQLFCSPWTCTQCQVEGGKINFPSRKMKSSAGG